MSLDLANLDPLCRRGFCYLDPSNTNYLKQSPVLCSMLSASPAKRQIHMFISTVCLTGLAGSSRSPFSCFCRAVVCFHLSHMMAQWLMACCLSVAYQSRVQDMIQTRKACLRPSRFKMCLSILITVVTLVQDSLGESREQIGLTVEGSQSDSFLLLGVCSFSLFNSGSYFRCQESWCLQPPTGWHSKHHRTDVSRKVVVVNAPSGSFPSLPARPVGPDNSVPQTPSACPKRPRFGPTRSLRPKVWWCQSLPRLNKSRPPRTIQDLIRSSSHQVASHQSRHVQRKSEAQHAARLPE